MVKINIDMPKNCKQCPLTYEEYYDFGGSTTRCVFDGCEISLEDERYYDCPLCEIKSEVEE